VKRSVRWLMTWAATAVAFVSCLWLAGTFSFPFEPRAASDRWVVAATFAAAMSAAVLTAISWWAGREKALPGANALGSQAIPGRSPTKAEQAPPPGRDHVDFRGSTFNAPVTGKGDINIDERWPPP
jgi:hypothetical protein